VSKRLSLKTTDGLLHLHLLLLLALLSELVFLVGSWLVLIPVGSLALAQTAGVANATIFHSIVTRQSTAIIVVNRLSGLLVRFRSTVQLLLNVVILVELALL